MRFALYDFVTGQIRQLMDCPNEEIAQTCVTPGYAVMPVGDDVSDHTHHVVRGAARPFPAKTHPLATWSWSRRAWEPPLVQEARAARWKEIKAERGRRIARPQQTSVGLLDGGAAGVANLNSVITLLRVAVARGRPDAARFTLADNSRVNLTLAQLEDAAMQMGAAIQDLHETAHSLRLRLNAARTVAEVDAVTWQV